MDNTTLPPVPPGAQPAMPSPSVPPPAAPSTGTSAVMALILGVLSVTCCGFFTGIPAFFVGRAELKAIEERRSAESNRALAKIGMILGIIGSIFMFLIGLAYVILIALGVSAGMMQDM